MADIKYQRLTRERSPRRFAAVGQARAALWLGDDHLLLVETSGITETYKRFFFRDIQAVTIRRTSRRKIWNWVLSAPLVLCALFVAFRAFDVRWIDGGEAGVLTVVGVVFGIPLLINNLLGSTCTCQLRTAVQTEELPSLCRLRKTRKVLAKIRPLIAAAQGQLTAEEVSARLRESVVAPPAAPTIPPPSATPPVIV